MIQNFNNKTQKVWEDLKKNIKKWSKLNIAAALFSIYGFDSLRSELWNIEKLRFIFTDSAFIEKETVKKEQRIFEIHANNIKKAISGSEFEINLKNELKWRAIAKECKKWIEVKVEFKSNISNRFIQPQFILDNNEEKYAYQGIDEFSSAWFWFENDNSIIRNIIKFDDYETTKYFLDTFEQV